MTSGTEIARGDGPIVLAPFAAAHAAELAHAIRESAGSVGRWLPWFHAAYGAAEAAALIARYGEDLAAGRAFNFGVFDRDAGDLVGGVGLNQRNPMHNFCNLCYWIRDTRQGRGFATAAVRALARHAFEALRFSRLELVVADGNTASLQVARKAGAQFECWARNRLLIAGTPQRAAVFSLLPEDLAD